MWFNRKKFVSGVLGKEPEDPRNYQLCDIQPEAVELPEEFLLMDKMSPIGHQNYGSCTAWAATGVKEYLDNKEYNRVINLSEKFVYHNTKKISQIFSTEGDYVKNALSSVCKYGAPLLEDYPDTKEKNWETYVKQEPSPEIYKKAEKYKGGTYWVVGNSLEQYLQAIKQQNAPVVFSMMWYKSYRKPAIDGKLPFPDTQLGGHAISCVGWTKDKLWFRNSHDLSWGYNGYAHIPFNEFSKHDIWNSWVLTDHPKLEEITGWAAETYLAKAKKFSPNEQVKSTTASLRIRENPTTNSGVLGSLKKDERAIIVDDKDNGISANEHRWWRIKVTVDSKQ